MAYRLVVQATVYWVGPGLGVMGGGLAPSLPNAPAGGAQSIEFDNQQGGYMAPTFTSTDITNLLALMSTDLSAQMNAQITRIQNFSTGTG
jgi:hypothetical protein